MVNWKVPTWSGVPFNVAVGASAATSCTPGGKAPRVSCQLNGPPTLDCAASIAEYGTPQVPPGNAAVEMTGGFSRISTRMSSVTVSSGDSASAMVNWNEPISVGLPETVAFAPLLVSERPGGTLPTCTNH